MDYEGISTLDELLGNSGATEFRGSIQALPVDKSESDFYQWAAVEAPATWDPAYHPMLRALSRLVKAEASYDVAMGQIRHLQNQLRPEPAADETPLQEPAQESIPDPAEAAREAVATIGPALIEELSRAYPDFASRLTPEELSSAVMDAIGDAVLEVSHG